MSDNGDGTLKTTVTYDGKTEFVNAYSALGAYQVKARKVLEGGVLADGQFVFELVDGEGNVVGTASNSSDGEITFDPIGIVLTQGRDEVVSYAVREVCEDVEVSSVMSEY